MTTQADLLEALQGAISVVEPGSLVTSEDVAGFDVGQAVAYVRPADTGEVVELVKVARRMGSPLVPVGKRTAYWRPLSQSGAVVVDLGDLSGALGEVEGQEATWFGAGTTLRDVESAFRDSGYALACHPDSYGDTSISAMVATGFSSGMGVGTAGLTGVVAGLEVVTGRGEVLRTGSAATLGAEAFMRAGLPDATDLFAGSDGALGIITAVAVRPWPRGHRARLSFQVSDHADRLLALADVARRLRAPGYLATFRAVAMRSPGETDGTRMVDMDVGPTATQEELDARIRLVRDALEQMEPSPEISELRERPDGQQIIPSWWDGEGGAAGALGGRQLLGLDVNVSYADFAEAAACLADYLRGVEPLPWFSARSGVYFAPDHVNLGCHVVVSPAGDQERRACEDVLKASMARVASLDIVPYRWGRLWGAHLGHQVDPAYRSLMEAVKRELDPDGILHPGASIWG